MSFVSVNGFKLKTAKDENKRVWYYGKDACHILGYGDIKQALKRIHKDEKQPLNMLVDDASYHEGKGIYLTQKGLKALVERCTREASKEFVK